MPSLIPGFFRCVIILLCCCCCSSVINRPITIAVQPHVPKKPGHYYMNTFYFLSIYLSSFFSFFFRGGGGSVGQYLRRCWACFKTYWPSLWCCWPPPPLPHVQHSIKLGNSTARSCMPPFLYIDGSHLPVSGYPLSIFFSLFCWAFSFFFYCPFVYVYNAGAILYVLDWSWAYI